MKFNKFALMFAGLMMFAPVAAQAQDCPSVAAGSKADAYVKDANDIAGATCMLKQVDKNHSPFRDQTIETKMVLNGGVHHDVTYSFTTHTKGGDKRAVRFHDPAEMRGMGVVMKGRDEVYARLSGSEKARRVGTYSKRQSFYGSDWAMDDMGMVNMAADYDIVKIINLDEKDHLVLELKLKDGVDLPYPKLVIKLDRSRLLMDYIEYFNEAGKSLKTQTRDTLKNLGNGYELYTHITVVNTDTKHQTENFVESEKINQDLPDSYFQQRWLTRSL